jgi:hypothetical protein
MTESQMMKLEQLDLYEFADQILINIPPTYRMKWYVDNNFDNVQTRLTHFGSNVKYQIGFNQVASILPIAGFLRGFDILSLFLGLIINVIIFILLFICTLLIYSLLITNVETRTFELGIFRMFGMKRIEVINLLLFQALAYAIFSYPLGIALAQWLAMGLTNSISTLVNVTIDPWLTTESILVAAMLRVVMPLFASIFPIHNAFGRNLAEALDTRQSKTKTVQISIARSKDDTVSIPTIIMDVAFSAFGFAVYYLMPLSLLSFNLSLLLYLFVSFLLAMLLGATLLALNLQNMLEQVLVNVYFFGILESSELWY